MTTEAKTVPLEEAREQVRKVCARLGLLHIAFARTLVDELGEKKGKELILKAIKDYGTKVGEEGEGEREIGIRFDEFHDICSARHRDSKSHIDTSPVHFEGLLFREKVKAQ